MYIPDNSGQSRRWGSGLDRLADRPASEREAQAARRLRRALERCGSGMAAKVPLARLGDGVGTHAPSASGDDYHAVERVDEALLLSRWCAAVRGDPALCAPVIFDLAGGGLSFSAADRRYRRRNGWARRQLSKAMQIYAQLSDLTDAGE